VDLYRVFRAAYNPLAVLWVICYFLGRPVREDEDCRVAAEVLSAIREE